MPSFGCFELEPQRRRLLRDGAPVALGARAFDVLLALSERSDRVVTKAELLDLAWHGLVVEENNLQVQISTLRKLLGAQAIATIPGRGYRFTLIADGARASAGGAAARTGEDLRQSKLPLDADPLIGRQAELDGVCQQIAAHRLTSLVGSGGIGKTRLARAVARRCLPDFSDGVGWVDLANLSQASSVAQAIAHATGVTLAEGDAPVLLSRALAGRHLLLVLDDCEHLVAAVTTVVQQLLAATTELRVLVTSQLALRMSGEQVWRLDALAVPPPDATPDEVARCGSVALFEQRARGVDHRFVIDAGALTQVADICRHLEGNALAIEMAAARAPQLGLAALCSRLSDPLRWLRSTDSTRPPRQQSLRATLDWSSSLLTEVERCVLRRLSVFVGSFRLESAQQLATDPQIDEWTALDAMGVLVEHSLLHVEQLDPPRYRLLETVRIYASELLAAAGEVIELERRHGQTMARLALQLRDDYRALDHGPFIALYLADYRDMEAAFDRACARSDAGVGAPTGAALGYFASALGVHSQVRTRMAAAHKLLPAAIDPLDRALLCRLVVQGGAIAIPGVSRLEMALEHVAAWREVGDRKGLYVSLCELAVQCALAGDLEAAQRALAEASALEDPLWLPRLRACREASLREISHFTGEVGASRVNARQWLSLAEASGDTTQALQLRGELAELATADGDFEEAITLGRLVVDSLQRLNNPAQYGMALARLCTAYLLVGDEARALDAATRALPELRPNLLAGFLFDPIAALAASRGDPESAARLMGHADQWYEAGQTPRGPRTEAKVMELALAAIDASIGATERNRLRAEGAGFSDAQADLLAWRVLGASRGGP